MSSDPKELSKYLRAVAERHAAEEARKQRTPVLLPTLVAAAVMTGAVLIVGTINFRDETAREFERTVGPVAEGERIFLTRRDGFLLAERLEAFDRVCRGAPIFNDPLYRP